MNKEEIEKFKADCDLLGLSSNEIVNEAIASLVDAMNRKSDGFRRVEKVALVAIYNLLNSNNQLIQDNLDLDRLYRRTAEKLRENGKEELAGYFLAQIGAVPTWTTFEEYKHWIHKDTLLKKIKELKKEAENGAWDYDYWNGIAAVEDLLEE